MSNEQVLRAGSDGEWVRYLQGRLGAAGVEPGPGHPDGDFGRRTEASPEPVWKMVQTAGATSSPQAEKEAQEDDASLDEVHPVLRITPRQLKAQGIQLPSWWETDGHFVWVGWEGNRSWSIQTYEYSEDEEFNEELRWQLQHGESSGNGLENVRVDNVSKIKLLCVSMLWVGA